MPSAVGFDVAAWSLAVRSLRARQWLHFCLLPAAALTPSSATLAAAWPRALAAALVAALAMAYAYGLNALTDRGSDADAGKNPLVGREAPPPAVAALVALVGALALGAAAALGSLALAATALSLVAATVYSAGPRIKAVPFAGTLANVPIFAPLLALGLRTGEHAPALPLLLAAFTALLVQNQVLHELADAAEDAVGAVRTSARTLGEARSLGAVVALGGAGVVACAALAPSTAQAVAAGGGLAAATLAPLLATRSAPGRRALHRRVAFAAGVALYAAGWGVA